MSSNATNLSKSPRSIKSSRPNSADSKQSWLSLKKTKNIFKAHNIDKTLKKIDQTFEKESAFIQQLEAKPQERAICRRQAAELLNKQWNDQVYIPTQTSIQKTMDGNSATYSTKLQEQYAHYLNHNNISDGAVYLDVFDENSGDAGDYQPLRLKKIQAEILKPEKVKCNNPLKSQYRSNYAKEINKDSDFNQSKRPSKNNINFWKTLKDHTHIESPERQRSRMRVKISDTNRKSFITLG